MISITDFCGACASKSKTFQEKRIFFTWLFKEETGNEKGGEKCVFFLILVVKVWIFGSECFRVFFPRSEFSLTNAHGGTQKRPTII